MRWSVGAYENLRKLLVVGIERIFRLQNLFICCAVVGRA